MSPDRPAFSYPAYVINLDRQPERYARFSAWNAATGIAIERAPAADGATLDAETRRAVAATDHLTDGAVGAALSHKTLWERAVAAGRPHVAFEDDVMLRADIAQALPRAMANLRTLWDIVLLGVNTDAVLVAPPGVKVDINAAYPKYPEEGDLLRFREESAPPVLLRLQHAFGLGGYMISPRGAEKLLRLSFPMAVRSIVSPVMRGAFPVAGLDSLLNAHYAASDAYVCWPPLVLPLNHQATSGTLPDRLKRPGKRR